MERWWPSWNVDSDRICSYLKRWETRVKSVNLVDGCLCPIFTFFKIQVTDLRIQFSSVFLPGDFQNLEEPVLHFLKIGYVFLALHSVSNSVLGLECYNDFNFRC